MQTLANFQVHNCHTQAADQSNGVTMVIILVVAEHVLNIQFDLGLTISYKIMLIDDKDVSRCIIISRASFDQTATSSHCLQSY